MNPDIALANERLTIALKRAGCSLRPTTGVIDGITVADAAGRDLFAWHRHPNHLFFYLRKPALAAKSTLRQKAIANHPDGRVRKNTGQETTITLKSDEEAQNLLGWLLPALPLP